MKISKENLVFLLIGGIIILIILNPSSPRKLVNEIKRSYKGFISNIYYQRGYHIVINTGVEEIDMTSFTYAFMCTVDKGDGIYKAANENYVTLIKSDSSLIKSSYLYINPSVRNDWKIQVFMNVIRVYVIIDLKNIIKNTIKLIIHRQ
jgi:hypothetical protein